MNQIFRNFVTILKCYKQSSLFNILGLSLAFVACYLIFIQAFYDFSFGKVHKDYQNTYRVNCQFGDLKAGVGAAVIKKHLDKSSSVVNSSLMSMFSENNFFADMDGEMMPIDISFLEIDSNMNEVLGFDMVAGKFSSIGDPNALIIPLSFAENMYGGAENAIGKRIFDKADSDDALEIVAVYRDFSELAVLNNSIYSHLDVDYDRSFNGLNNIVYFNTTDGANMEQLASELSADIAVALKNIGAKLIISFTSLDEVYFDRDTQYVAHPTGNKSVSVTLVFVAMLIMIIAIINFVNFSIALAPRRIKSINTYRVLGHSLVGLRFMLVFEAILISIISLLLSICFILLISDTTITNVFSSSILLANNPYTLVLMSLFAVLVGVIAGIYPAFHITNFSPALVLNGGKSLPKSALLIRQFLISFQYIISITMIIISVFINFQNNYMMNKDYGYDTKNLLEVEISRNQSQIKAQLLEDYSFIEDIAFSRNSMTSGINYQVNGSGNNGTGSNYFYDFTYVSHNYPKLMGLEIIEGDHFVEADRQYALLNETAKKVIKAEVGDAIEPNGVIVKGFFKDVNHKSLHSVIDPLVLLVAKPSNSTLMSVRYVGDQNIGNVIDAIRQVVAEVNDGQIANISTADQVRYAAYKKDANVNTIISWAAILAILISVIGVVGLISLESQQRIREIALRKVYEIGRAHV